MEKISNFINKYKIELIIFLFSFLFSWWLMFATFSYSNGEMQISSKAWSDFANHIPLIRSFSFGSNFPPQYPLFSGPPIKYHFLFYAFVGILEKLNIPIDYALNLPSVLGFSFLIIMIYIFAKNIFNSKAVGILSILFFIFNGSLEFIKFFLKNPVSINSIYQIINNRNFISFGPYDGSVISAFWNLNIYTNQRHLALSYGLSLFIIYCFLKFNNEKRRNIKKSILIGIILGISFLLNMAVFLITIIILTVFLIYLNKYRLYIFISLVISGALSIPIYLYMQQGGSSFKIIPHIGYLITNTTLLTFLNYWFQNIGIHLLLIPLGFMIANNKQRRIFLSFFIVFAIGNLFQFSPEIAANHKFFNYFMIIGVIFSAYFLVWLWKKIYFIRPLIPILFFFLIFSGILDFFPIYNDYKISLSDYPTNKDVSWIIKNTKPNSIFLNSQFLYDNASLAGRKIFLGWPYFAWSQGYNTNLRDNLRKQLLATNDLTFFCKITRANHIDYVETGLYNANDLNQVQISQLMESDLKTTYQNTKSGYKIYSINSNCKKYDNQ